MNGIATSLASTSRTLEDLHAHKNGLKSEEKFILYITRFRLVETAEETSQWSSRSKQQWDATNPIIIHVKSKLVRIGSTPPKMIKYDRQGWTGAEWGLESGFEVPIHEEPMLLIEVASTKHPNIIIGLGAFNVQSIATESNQYLRYCLHITPTKTAIDSEAVHAVLDVEIHSSLLDEPPESNYMPLEYNYTAVRVSTMDLYYPPFLLSDAGQYIVSNVICVMNMTESSSLAMQLVPLKEASVYINIEPPNVITVRPQQRMYFSATWIHSQKACMRALEIRLVVNGLQRPSAPIVIKAHLTIPQPTTTNIPYHYWVNTTCITNRSILASQELPILRAILPVYRVLSSSGFVDPTEGMIVAFDKDKGEQVLLRNDGMPLTMSRPGSQWSKLAMDSALRRDGVIQGIDISQTNITDLFSESLLNANGSFVVQEADQVDSFPMRRPLLNLYQKTCMCTIVLGTIYGFPMVLGLSTGISPSFQVSITLLDQKGWQIVIGDTLPSYQSASGSLRWIEHLVLLKWPGADSTQFIRLNLTEVRPQDGDETPIGAGLISLNRMDRIHAMNSLSVAFYVYETYSLYDQLNSSSLLMKDVKVIFSEMR
ncbi:unnamed protein product [Phytomonas sp. Hart1]|nr:unnamed protein product [Phytomonas sp. Hart1]|eukprot:CCW66339.1 unnamed protein product [Phytomonas sp. isolate Hart1]